MEWLYILMPISGVNIFWPGLLILGFGVGIIGGFFGMGGAWMVTPGLNILGFPMAFAIGTDVAQMAGKSLISTMRHGKFGNVDYMLGVTMLIGTIFGVELGAQMVMWLERIGSVDKVVRWLYVVLLISIAWLVFHDAAVRRRKEREAKAHQTELDATAVGVDWASRLQAIRIPPVVHFKHANITCSAWLPIAVSFFTGWLAGILGIGGGLIRMPALVYLVGCPTHLAVGTDLFEVAISGLYGTASYAYKGRVELLAALIMLAGAAVGAQIGVVATKYVKGYGIRFVFGLAVLGCLMSVVLKLLEAEFPAWGWLLGPLATVEVLGFVSAISIYIAVKMVQGAKAELAAKKMRAANS
ncbi:MAG: sulfite exporter TauE/SafE family protein [Desulfovibrio sp.]|uniref:sulfite exporter TauE/SafE family protein n=1 Tax=Desulfovibrio sp. TaxID=885 RepID=UPI002A3654E9|nr:sulfite exporter TauE/SafE family protein [Desulfovibrio sp.]MDY0259658.1 sulfite exporter TauE/SafE family protein [Desulfovibrio sp.]